MEEMLSTILGELSGIVTAIFSSIKNDLLSSPQPRSLEEQLYDKVRGQSSLINSQQDRLSYQTGVIQDQSREIRYRDDLLIQKDKEVKNLTAYARDLEFQLQEEASRNKRWR